MDRITITVVIDKDEWVKPPALRAALIQAKAENAAAGLARLASERWGA